MIDGNILCLNFNIQKASAVKTDGLDNEVKYCIECCGMTPEEALKEWDLL